MRMAGPEFRGDQRPKHLGWNEPETHPADVLMALAIVGAVLALVWMIVEAL